MPIIQLTTKINAPIEVCFDCARNIDIHKESLSSTGEEAIGGITRGLIGPGESVTWRAKHFGVWHRLTSEITAYDRPKHFRDSMKSGIFARFDHDHFFESEDGYTVMRDKFDYTSPFGVLGNIADALVLKGYMTQFLLQHNSFVKIAAERQAASLT